MDLRAIHAQRLAEQAAAKKAADESMLSIFAAGKTAAVDLAHENDSPAPSFEEQTIAGLRAVVASADEERIDRENQCSTDELFRAGHALIERGYRKWVDTMADSIAKDLAAFDTASGDGWDEWSREQIEGAVDGTMIYNRDIDACLYVSRNADYAIDEGLAEAGSVERITLSHYAFLQDVTEELGRRGALEEPEPPSGLPESDDCLDTEPRTDSAVDPRVAYHGDGEPPFQAIDIDSMLSKP
jgi:hypothetical protein